MKIQRFLHRGGATVLAAAEATFPRMGADLKAIFSLPSFHDHFSAEDGIADPDLAATLKTAIDNLAS